MTDRARREAAPAGTSSGEALREALVETLTRLGAPRRRVDPRAVKPMLAETCARPFSSPEWIFELKYDGFRLLAARERSGARLFYRRGTEVTKTFPDIVRALEALPFEHVVLDGEVVVLDDEGRPSFQRLQKRVQLLRPADTARAARKLPAVAFFFDVLGFEDFDLRPLPLLDRKRVLRSLLPRDGPLRFADHVEERGEALYREIGALELEGLIAKRRSSPYRERRSGDWLKLKLDRSGDFVVVGFTEPKAGRSGFGALHLGVPDGAGGLRYAGRAGSGFTDRQLSELRRRLDAARRPAPAFEGPGPAGQGHVWVEPQLVCEVRYREWTEEGLLRQPVFLRFRDDKTIEDCVDERSGAPARRT